MKKNYNFTLSLPPTLNNTYKISNSRMYKSKEAIDWQEEIGWRVRQGKPILGPVLLEIVMYLKRDRDIDGSLKLLFDTFQHVGVYKNDSQVVDLHVIKAVDKKDPHMDVTITEL